MALGVLLLLFAAASAQITEIDTEYGRIQGEYDPESKVTSYYGIPFAAPPVGDLRFKPPVPPRPWSGTKDCRVDHYLNVSSKARQRPRGPVALVINPT